MLTKTETEALSFIENYISLYGYAPTLEEIGKFLGATKQRAHQIVDLLVVRGKIKKIKARQRNIKLIGRK
jgi:SOS-response transcriptional repressor LexA